MNSLQNPLTLAGRVLLALLFLPAGLSKIAGFAGTVGYISAMGVPFAALCAVIAIVVEVGGGLALIAGFQTRWVALGLAVFTLVITPIFHAFWGIPADQVMMQQTNFFKNLALVGGLLALASAGAGRWSVDARLAA